MRDRARARSAPARNVALILGLLLVAAVGAAALASVAVQAQAQAQGAPPAELTEEELLSRITAAPESAPDFSATVTVEQTVVPEGLLGASQGNGAGSSGPRTARIEHGGPDQFRAELLGQNGDQIFVKNGSEISAYDGATNTLRTGQKPEAVDEQHPEQAASPEEINEVLAEISPTSDLRTGSPVQVADRWAYPLTLEPKDKSQTLIERAEAFVDAEAFVPLSFELYAENNPEPVIRYEASDFQVGDVPDARFQFETPPNATVEAMEKPGNDEEQDEEAREDKEPQQVASIEEAQQIVGFPVGQLNAPGGRELAEIRVAGSKSVVQTYGSGWGTVTLVQKPESTEEAQEGEPQEEDSGREGDGQQLEIPTVDLGGVEAKEISTSIGTALSWNVDGVSYHLVGSAPAAELEEAARGLLR